jgi:hippurate hydrolase
VLPRTGSAKTPQWLSLTAAEVDAVYPDIETLYIDLHRYPELAFQEVQTAAKLAARVKALGYEVLPASGEPA